MYSFNRYYVLWFILLVTMIFDYLSTVDFVRIWGARAEANFLIDWLIKSFGLRTGVLIGKSLQLVPAVFFVCLNKRFGNLFLLTLILINIWAVYINNS